MSHEGRWTRRARRPLHAGILICVVAPTDRTGVNGDAVVVEWAPSRIASPAELLVLPAIAMGVRLLLWVSTTMGKRRQVRVSLLIGNGVNAFVNSAVVVLLVGQLSSGAESTLPWLVLGISLVAAAVTVAISWFLLQTPTTNDRILERTPYSSYSASSERLTSIASRPGAAKTSSAMTELHAR